MFGLNESLDIPTTVDRVTAAMSTHRQYLSNQTVAHGGTRSLDTYVHVTWFWIVPPGIMIVIRIVCLILATIETKKMACLCGTPRN